MPKDTWVDECYECCRCGNVVPLHEIYATAVGLLCDNCYWEAIDFEELEEVEAGC